MEGTTPLKRAVLYLRVSTERQARSGGEKEGYSIPAQREAGRRKAASLGAEVVEEYVDAGASAKSADRVGLQSMLARLEEERDVDLVIVHKLDRLARSRMDDVIIMAGIERAGAQLVSCTENLDESPQGRLLHGIMASMAEFYIQNLASEAKKGLHEKAKRGGTPGPAPIGYLNATTRVEGVETKTVVVDEKRAPHLQWAFESYATGQWSLSELTQELERRGLRTRATRRYAGRPLTRSQVHRALSNEYYVGKVFYGGVSYDGRHQALVDEEIFGTVQDQLAGRKVAGDRSWRRQQYLKGTVFCHRCGERMGYGHNTGKSGTSYPYFFCLGRHRRRTECDLPYLPAAKVEAAVVAEWHSVTFSGELISGVRTAVGGEFESMLRRDHLVVAEQTKRVARLEARRTRLLDGFTDGIIAKTDFAERQAAVDRELREARKLISGASRIHKELKERVETNLALLRHAGQLYELLPDDGRQTLNQVRYEALEIDVDEDGNVFVADRELTEVAEAFELVANDVRQDLGESPRRDHEDKSDGQSNRQHRPPARPSGFHGGSRHPRHQTDVKRRGRKTTNPARYRDRGSNLTNLAERGGFEDVALGLAELPGQGDSQRFPDRKWEQPWEQRINELPALRTTSASRFAGVRSGFPPAQRPWSVTANPGATGGEQSHGVAPYVDCDTNPARGRRS